MKRACITTGVLCASMSSAAHATLFEWEWDRGDPGAYGLNDNGGRFFGVDASFDTTSNLLSWTVEFTNDVTEGFTLVVNNGPNPQGHAGELAQLYVDVSDPSDVMITAYNYNGRNLTNAWRDGNGEVGGDQTPDLIMNANQRDDWVLSSSVVDNNGARTISFTVDVTQILAHSPLYPDPNLPAGADPRDSWHGTGFDNGLSLLMHPFRTFNATYDAQTGAIASLQTGGEGWFDGRDFFAVPAPGASAVFAVVGLAGMRRRRA